MADNDLKKILKKLNSIEGAVKSIDSRVSILEGEETPVSEPEPVKETTIEPKKEPEAKGITEREIGGKWLAYGGIVAVVIAAGWLILFAIENNWISPEVQILMGIAIGAILLFIGNLIEKRGLEFHSKIFYAGGFPVIFYSFFSAYQYYNLIPFEITALLITLMVLGAVFLAYKKNSRIIAAESFLLAYLLPLITLKFDLFLLAYSLILFGGMMLLLKKKPWTFLYIGGFILNSLMYLIWTLASLPFFKPSSFDPFYAIVFLAIFFVLFLIGSIFYSARKDRFALTTGFLLLAPFLFYFSMLNTIQTNFPEYDWYFKIGFLLALLALAFLTKTMQEIYIINKILFLSFIAVVITSLHAIPALMVLLFSYSVLLIREAFKEKNKTLLYFGWLSSVLGFVYSFVFINKFQPIDLSIILDNNWLFTGIVGIPLFYYLWNISKNQAIKTKDKRIETASKIFFGIGAILVFLFVTSGVNGMEIELASKPLLVSIVWILLAAFYLLFGFLKKLKISRITGIVLFALAIIKVFILDLAGLTVFYRVISFFVLGVILLLSAFLYKKYEKQFE